MYSRKLRDVRKALDHIEGCPRVSAAGRQGTFNYVNMHVTMQMGIKAARKVTEED